MSTATQGIRRTRFWPEVYDIPDDRAKTLRAALQQFEELIAAAAAAGPASAPLPLFYALSQAGRAIAALRLEKPWQLRGHGLSFRGVVEDGIAPSRITIRAPGREGRPMDSFRGVARAVGSPVPGDEATVTLDEVVLSISDLSAGSVGGPLAIDTDVGWKDSEADRGHVLAALQIPEDLRTSSNLRVELRRRLRDYPRGGQLRIPTEDFLIKDPASGGWLEVYLPIEHAPTLHEDHRGWHAAADAALDEVAARSRDPRDRKRYLRPTLAGVEMDPLMAWWLLLHGLSAVARYHPAGWRAALDVDTSPDAVTLENVVATAIDVVPHLILSALEDAVVPDGGV